MPATSTDRLNGLTTSVAVKPPCAAVTSANITLSGLQTIGGVALVEGDRVLVRAQTSSVDNGVYNASTSDWTRAKDFDGALDAVQGTLVLVRTGSVDGAIYEVTTANPIVFDASAITFELRDDPAATYPQTQAEINVGATPVNYAYAPGIDDRYSSVPDYATLRALAAQNGVANYSRDSLFNGVNVGKGRNTGNTHGTAIGENVLQSAGAGEDNTGVGYEVMIGHAGLRSTAVGSGAMRSSTSGYQCAAFGHHSQWSLTTGSYNTSAGAFSLFSALQASENSAYGETALYSNTVGNKNNAFGVQCAYSQVTADETTGFGYRVLFANVTAPGNCGFGFRVMENLLPTSKAITAFADYSGTVPGTVRATSASHGRTNGDSLVIATVSGQYVGTYSITVIDTDNFYFTAAFVATTTGWWQIAGLSINNSAFGNRAAQAATTASGLSAFGASSLIALTTGVDDSAFGRSSLAAVTTGSRNTAGGALSGLSVTTGNDITLFGYNACSGSTTASDITAFGSGALSSCTGATNTAIGKAGLGNLTTQTNCSGLGANTAITGSNQVQLGDSATTTYAYGAVQNRSDARDKTDIRDTLMGLDFINALRPVDFRWDYREDYDWQEKDGSKKRARFHHGLIAQEVKAACDAAGVDFGGYQDHSLKGGKDVLSIGYEELVPVLIKAVQELCVKVAALEATTK